jgi:leucine dehydrogenase
MSALWASADFDDHENVHFVTDRDSGLRAIIAVHSTHLGPAGGGARFWHYGDDAAALTDALRLSRGMSYKNAMAGLAMGGGKAVILAPVDKRKSPELIAAFARAINRLGGAYVTAQDVGMSAQDMIDIGTVSPYVSGLPAKDGMAGGDPGPTTSLGVFTGVRAVAARLFGHDDLKGVRVAIQGVGSVGGGLARYLAEAGATLLLSDTDEARATALAAELSAEHVAADQILTAEADIFAPCALGAILNAASIPTLKVRAVAGGANNQLAKPDDGDRLRDRGILYAPDYVINAGGIINVAMQYLDGATREAVNARVAGIADRLNQIWDEADVTGQNPAQVADLMARRLIGRG